MQLFYGSSILYHILSTTLEVVIRSHRIPQRYSGLVHGETLHLHQDFWVHLYPLSNSHVPGRLIVREISYQIVEERSVAYLSTSENKMWPIFPIGVGIFIFLNVPHARKGDATLK
jgi:hypothetical protein